MSAMKSEMQIPCTLVKTETRSVADAQEDLTVNVIPKAESSFCSNCNKTQCLQIGFMQHDRSCGKKLHDLKIDPPVQEHCRCENIPKLETNFQISNSFIKIERQTGHIVKIECMTEHNQRVKTEMVLPGQEEVCQPNSDNGFYWTCQGITHEVKTQYGLHHGENANGPVSFEVKHEDYSGQEVGSIVKAEQTHGENANGPVSSEVKHEDYSGQEVGSIVNAEQTKSLSQYKERWNIRVATKMEHLKAQSTPQELEYSCRKNKNILPFLSSSEQDVDVAVTQVMDIATESPQHETNVTVTEASVSTESEEQRHSKDTKSYECKVCMSSFSFPSLVKKHMLIHNMKQHMHVHSDEKPHKCSVCNAAFKTLSNLKHHMYVHSDEKLNKCSVCKAAFKTLSNLKHHMYVHSDEKPHKCSVCNAAFNRLNTLKQHMYVHSDEKPHKCSVCKAAFKRLSNLKNHMYVHSDEKPHKCSVCNAAFKTLDTLKQHMYVHSDERPHKCSVCEAAFKTLGNLKHHMYVHSDEKPHKCSVCKAAFKRLDALKKHMYAHSAEKPHKCSICKTAFKRLDHLKKHMHVHSDEKPHKCRVHEAAFKTVSNFKVHMQNHGNEETLPVQCV